MANVEYIFDETIKDIIQDDNLDKVNVIFTNRLPSTNYDLVVGADGQISRTRRLVFGHGPQNDDYLRRMGQYMAFFTIPRIESDTRWAQWYATTGGRYMLTRPSPYNDTRAFLGVVDWDIKRFADVEDAVRKRDERKMKEWLVKQYQGAGWQCERLLKGLETTEDFYMHETAQVRLGEQGFAKGRVALLGDAGYCPSPLSGMVSIFYLAPRRKETDSPGYRCRHGRILRACWRDSKLTKRHPIGPATVRDNTTAVRRPMPEAVPRSAPDWCSAICVGLEARSHARYCDCLSRVGSHRALGEMDHAKGFPAGQVAASERIPWNVCCVDETVRRS